MASPREISRVVPPPNSVPPTSLPLTFFDVYCLHGPPVKRFFFYELTHPKTYFLDTILPKLQTSLSLTLQHFYPLAGNLTHSPESGKLVLRYREGDSVELTVTESDAEFYQFIQNNPRDVSGDDLLAPDLPISHTSETPVLALQVTIFPDSGICIGISTHHVAVDLRSTLYFMKSWAFVCRLGDASSLDPLPCHDRSMIKDPNGLEMIFSEQWRKFLAEKSLVKATEKRGADSVIGWFVLKRADIERLRKLVSAIRGDNLVHSTFMLTSAYVWACSVKARRVEGHEANDTQHMVFAADIRARMEPAVPETYFGNCMATCVVETNGGDLVGEGGIAVGSEAIGNVVRGLKNRVNGVLSGAENWIPKICVLKEPVTVSGSPKFQVYDTDFGWGRPSKVEADFGVNTNGMSLAENINEEEGGVEIGLVRPKHQMDAFASLFQEGLKDEEKKKASPSIFSRKSTEGFSNSRIDHPHHTSSFSGITSTRHYSTISTGVFTVNSPICCYSIGIPYVATITAYISPRTTSIPIFNPISAVVACCPADREHAGTGRFHTERNFSFWRQNFHRRIGYVWRTFRQVLA